MFNNTNNALLKSSFISILDYYSLLVDSKIDKAQRNPKYLDYINIVQDVTDKKLEMVKNLDTVSSLHINSDEVENDVGNGFFEKVMIQHLGYALRENTSVSFMSEYEKSDFSKIIELTFYITRKIPNVNLMNSF